VGLPPCTGGHWLLNNDSVLSEWVMGSQSPCSGKAGPGFLQGKMSVRGAMAEDWPSSSGVGWTEGHGGMVGEIVGGVVFRPLAFPRLQVSWPQHSHGALHWLCHPPTQA